MNGILLAVSSLRFVAAVRIPGVGALIPVGSETNSPDLSEIEVRRLNRANAGSPVWPGAFVAFRPATSGAWLPIPDVDRPGSLEVREGTVLRPPRVEDIEGILVQSQDPEVSQWTTVPAPYTLLDAHTFMRRSMDTWITGDEASFALVMQGRFAGLVSLSFTRDGAADIGYALSPFARGTGVMSAAVKSVLRWGFTARSLEVVFWQAIEGNLASRGVAERCGFQVTGTIGRYAVQRGVRRDAWVGYLTRERHLELEVP